MRSANTKTILGHIAGNIRKLRKSRKITQEQLAEKAEVDTRFLQRIERGTENISIDVLVALADALGIRPATLFRYAKVAPSKAGRPPAKKKKAGKGSK